MEYRVLIGETELTYGTSLEVVNLADRFFPYAMSHHISNPLTGYKNGIFLNIECGKDDLTLLPAVDKLVFGWSGRDEDFLQPLLPDLNLAEIMPDGDPRYPGGLVKHLAVNVGEIRRMNPGAIVSTIDAETTLNQIGSLLTLSPVEPDYFILNRPEVEPRREGGGRVRVPEI